MDIFTKKDLTAIICFLLIGIFASYAKAGEAPEQPTYCDGSPASEVINCPRFWLRK